ISPLARCLMKAKAGDEVVLHTPDGDEYIEINDVRYVAIE
ncbi:MAG: GreA/GreB family elongation factor, partial [Neisseriaceae bacterium]|nr:GreA/GreB family elongation factor [Neisseriaceae bacterium]